MIQVEFIAHKFRVNRSKLDKLELMQYQLSLICQRYCQGWGKVVITFGEDFLNDNCFIRISNQ